MDDDASEANCTLERCVNARANLKMVLNDNRQRANEMNNYSKVQAEAETLRLKLASVDVILQEQTQKAFEAINAKEIAEANHKQIESDWEFLRKKVGVLEEKADDADKHREQANHWRNKYDEMCCLAEKLEANNIDIKSKYEAAVKTFGVVSKKTVSYETQIAELKTLKSDAVQKAKKLDKYLKSAIETIDSLSKSTNLAKQPKKLRDLVGVFRRDDVRLFFNSEPWTATSQNPPPPEDSDNDGDAPEALPPPEDDSMLLGSGQRLSDSEVDEMADDDDELAVQKLESMLTSHVICQKTERPEFTTRMEELAARRGAPRILPASQMKQWPSGIRRPEPVDSGGLLNPKRLHSRQVPTTCDFDAIASATELRKKALLGKAAEDSGAAGAAGTPSRGGTIHGKKGKTVREQQAEMMNKETVKEKAARMRMEAARIAKIAALSPSKRTTPRPVGQPPRTRHQSFLASRRRDSDDEEDSGESGDDSDDEEYKLEAKKAGKKKPTPTPTPPPARRGRGRPRSTSVHPATRGDVDDDDEVEQKKKKTTPSRKEQSTSPTPQQRRSSRITTRSASRASSRRPSPTPSTSSTRGERACASRASSRRPSPTPSTCSTRGERARARSVYRESHDADVIGANSSARRSQSVGRRVLIDTDDEEEDLLLEETKKSVETSIEKTKKIEDVPKIREEDEKTGDVLRRRLQEVAKKRAAAPAPANDGPPLRTRRMERMKAPVVVKKTSEDSEKHAEFGDISSSSNESVLQEAPHHHEIPDFDDVPVFEPSTSSAPEAPRALDDPRAPEAVKDVVPETPEVSRAPEDFVTISDESSIYEDASDTFKKPITEIQKTSEGVEIQKTSEDKPKQPEVVRTLSEASSNDSGDVQFIQEVPMAPLSMSGILDPIIPTIPTPKEPQTVRSYHKDPRIPTSSAPTPPVVLQIPQNPSQPAENTPEVKRRQSGPPKSPQHQIAIQQLGMELSDSEEELEIELEEFKPTPHESSGPLVLEEPPSQRGSQEAVPSTTTSSSSYNSSSSYTSSTKLVIPTPVITVSSESTASSFASSSTTSSAGLTPLNAHDDLLADIISGAHMTKKTAAVKKQTPVARTVAKKEPRSSSSKLEAPAPTKIIVKPASEVPAPSVKPSEDVEQEKEEEDEVKKAPAPRVSSRRTPPTKAVTESKETKLGPNGPKPEAPKATDSKPGPQKRSAPSSEAAGPAPKRQYTRKPVQVIDAIPLKRGRPPGRSRATSEDPPPSSSSLPTSSGSESQQSVDGASSSSSSATTTTTTAATTSPKMARPMKTMVIDVPVRPYGRAIRQDTKMLAKSGGAVERGGGGGKRVDKNKAHFRQALDLKLGLNELKRQMEDKGIVLNDSIPLSPEDAVDVMMEFLRESSPADMWAVLMRQKTSGSVMPLVNTEEQNFLQVSASLIVDDNKLLELFIKRILYEISLRDSIDAKQCGRLVRLFCHTLNFVKHIPVEAPESSDDAPESVDDVLDEKRSNWMRSLFLVLLYTNPQQFAKSFAYCLISDMSAYCQFMVDELEESTTTSSQLHVTARILICKEPDQASVVNWLLNSKFQTAYIQPMTSDEIQKVCLGANRLYVENDGEDLKTSLFLAKTGDSEVLSVAFRLLQEHMALIERQFLAPKEKAAELKHRTAYNVPTVANKMSASEAHALRRMAEWQKAVLLVMIDNPGSTHYQEIMKALTMISPQIVSFREIVDSSDVEQYVDTEGVDDVRESVQHFVELTSEFTSYPLKSSTF